MPLHTHVYNVEINIYFYNVVTFQVAVESCLTWRDNLRGLQQDSFLVFFLEAEKCIQYRSATLPHF